MPATPAAIAPSSDDISAVRHDTALVDIESGFSQPVYQIIHQAVFHDEAGQISPTMKIKDGSQSQQLFLMGFRSVNAAKFPKRSDPQDRLPEKRT